MSSARNGTVTEAGEQRRTQILEAALRCFDRHGVSATTIEDIRTESGASIGSIYHHLGGKDDIITELYVEAVSAYRLGMLTALGSDLLPSVAVRAAVDFHVGWIEAHRSLARLTLRWDQSELTPTGQRQLASEAKRFDRGLEVWHHQGVDTGMLRPMAREVFAAQLLGPLLEYARRLANGMATVPINDAAAALADGLCRSLLADSAEPAPT